MRFIHAADIHLDSPLRGLGSYEDMPVDTIRGATRAAFTRLVDEALALEVDFMVIAGDLYDGDWKDHNTGIYFARQMGRLSNGGIPVYLLHGNHDAESVMTKNLVLPDNVYVFDARRPSTFMLETHKVALHGRSFPHAAVTENIVNGYPDPVAGYFNIGVLHTALEGSAQHANYAPCSLQQLHARGYQYWALGHVHDYSVFPGPVPVVFPGNLQGRHIRETGPRGAVLVHCTEIEVEAIQRLEVDVLRWHAITVDLTGCESRAQVHSCIRDTVGHELAELETDRPYIFRLTLDGETGVHGELLADRFQLRTDVAAMMAALAGDQLWLEKLRLKTHPPRRRHATVDSDDLADLLSEAAADPQFLAELRQGLQPMLDKAPYELTEQVAAFAALKAATPEDAVSGAGTQVLTETILQDAVAALLARLEKEA